MPEWGSSRFNNSATTPDGALIVWNSLSGHSNVFEGPLARQVETALEHPADGDDRGALVTYLAKRGYLVPSDLDESDALAKIGDLEQYRQDSLQLILLSSEECNFRCKYCYENFARGVMYPRVRQSVLKLLRREAPKLRKLSVTWFGGEPLHGLDAIREIAPTAHALAQEHSLSWDSHITTNGYLLTQTVAEELIGWGISRFQITLDGPAELHNGSRPLKEGGETYDVILSNLKAMKAIRSPFLVRIRTNFYRESMNTLDPYVEMLAKEFGSDKRFNLAFHPVGKWGGPNDDKLDVCGVKEGKTSRLRLAAAAAALGAPVGNTLIDVRMPGSGTCYAARPYAYVIGADGKLMKCTVALDTDERNIIGHIDDDGRLVVDAERHGLWTGPMYRTDSTCTTCSVGGSCQGLSCPLVRIQDGYRPCAATPKPALKQELITVAQLLRPRVSPPASAPPQPEAVA